MKGYVVLALNTAMDIAGKRMRMKGHNRLISPQQYLEACRKVGGDPQEWYAARNELRSLADQGFLRRWPGGRFYVVEGKA